MYIYTHIHIYIYTHTFTYIYTYIYIDLYTHIHINAFGIDNWPYNIDHRSLHLVMLLFV